MLVITAMQSGARPIYSVATTEHGSRVSTELDVAAEFLRRLGVDDPVPRLEAALETGVAEILDDNAQVRHRGMLSGSRKLRG
jgi:hypothetical protein